MALLNSSDYRAAAKRRLPKGLFEYIDRGTEAELAMDDIRRSLDAIKFRPSVLTGYSSSDMTVSLFDRTYPTPLIIAPTALAGLVDRRRTPPRWVPPYCKPVVSRIVEP